MRKRKVFCLAGLCVCMALGTPVTAFADTVYVNASSLNYRETPSLDGKILGTLPRGVSVSREKENGEWSTIVVGNTRCYAASRYLSSDVRETMEPVSSSMIPADSPYVDQTWEVPLKAEYPYASFAEITSGHAIYYHNNAEKRKGKTVCVNAGHGTKGGSSVKTLCHPDGSPKVTGGTTSSGAVMAAAVSSGMTFSDGTAESTVTLSMAKVLREKLLAAGYDVLMIREEKDVQLDNIARTVIANNNADCHIALHWDSTATDKGAFFMSVPSVSTYRAMEPVASHWELHNRLGSSLIEGLQKAGIKIFSSGSMEMDLTQTSYSTIPSVDIELGDKASDHSAETLDRLADGLLAGIDLYFGY